MVAYRAFAGRRHPHDTSFGHGKNPAVDLEAARSAEEEVEFFVVFVGVQETAFRSGCELLKGEFATGGPDGCAAEYFSRDFHRRSQLQDVIVQFVRFSDVDCAEVLRSGNGLDLFHAYRFLCVKLSFREVNVWYYVLYCNKLRLRYLVTCGSLLQDVSRLRIDKNLRFSLTRCPRNG